MKNFLNLAQKMCSMTILDKDFYSIWYIIEEGYSYKRAALTLKASKIAFERGEIKVSESLKKEAKRIANTARELAMREDKFFTQKTYFIELFGQRREIQKNGFIFFEDNGSHPLSGCDLGAVDDVSIYNGLLFDLNSCDNLSQAKKLVNDTDGMPQVD